MATWQLLGGPATQAPDVLLTKAKGRSITWRLREPSTLDFSIDGRHPQAGYLQELVTDVHLVRNSQVLYTGRMGGSDDDVDAGTHDVTVSTADTRALLDRRLWPAPGTTYTGDTGALARELVTQAQAKAGGDLGISVAGVPDSGTTMTRELKGGAAILAELDAAAEHGRPDAGFEWDVSPGWEDRELQLWAPQRGQDRGMVLDYIYTGQPRSSIVAKVTRQVAPGDYANAVRVIGGVRVETHRDVVTYTDAETGETVTETNEYELRFPTQPVYRSIAADGPEGVWESRISDETLVWQSEVEARADAELARLAMVQPAYTVTLRGGAWDGPEHIWLGDTVQLLVRSGRLQVDAQLRVLELKLDLGDSGQEQVELTVGRPVPTLLRHLHATERRLTRLER